MRTLGFLVVVTMFAACRVGFEDRPDGAPPPPPPPPGVDAASPPPPIDAPPPPAVLACGAAVRFSMVKAPAQVTATATTDGYNLITIDAAGVHGYAYGFVGSDLVAHRGDVPIVTGVTAPTGEISTIANGDNTLLAVTSGTPKLDTTTVIGLDRQLAPLAGPATHSPWVGGLGSMARNDAGTLALLGTLVPSSEVDVRIIAPDGTPAGPSHVVIPDGGSPSIVAAGDDLLAVWASYSGTSNKVNAALHSLTNNSFVTKIAAKAISTDPVNDAFNARGAYMASSGLSLITWMQKPGDPLDHIWISLRDRDLNEVGTAKDIGQGNLPMVVAGARDFLVVWRIDGIRLSAVRVKPDGSVQQVPVEGTARDAIGMDLVVRAGQPALVWVESGDSGGATVRFDPLCGS